MDNYKGAKTLYNFFKLFGMKPVLAHGVCSACESGMRSWQCWQCLFLWEVSCLLRNWRDVNLIRCTYLCMHKTYFLDSSQAPLQLQLGTVSYLQLSQCTLMPDWSDHRCFAIILLCIATLNFVLLSVFNFKHAQLDSTSPSTISFIVDNFCSWHLSTLYSVAHSRLNLLLILYYWKSMLCNASFSFQAREG